MSKEQTTVNEMANTAVVTELQENNKKLRGQIQQLFSDNAQIVRTLDDVTTMQLHDVRNLLRLLPSIRDEEQRASVLCAVHSLLDEIEIDVQLILQDGIDELTERYKVNADKVLRGGEDL